LVVPQTKTNARIVERNKRNRKRSRKQKKQKRKEKKQKKEDKEDLDDDNPAGFSATNDQAEFGDQASMPSPRPPVKELETVAESATGPVSLDEPKKEKKDKKEKKAGKTTLDDAGAKKPKAKTQDSKTKDKAKTQGETAGKGDTAEKKPKAKTQDFEAKTAKAKKK